MHSYYMAGLLIGSEIALPGLLAQGDDGGPSEISIRRDKVASALNNEQRAQFRQKLPTWSGHVSSWLNQCDVPVHLVRYEELKALTVRLRGDQSS